MEKAKAKISSDAEIDAAMARARAECNDDPLAVSVKYVSALDIYVVNLADGTRLVLQRENLQGLQTATKKQLSNVEVLGPGTGIHWEDLDVDLYVPALIEGVYGTRRWMAKLGRKGGSVRSEAKAASSRANGRKGGRPTRVASLLTE